MSTQLGPQTSSIWSLEDPSPMHSVRNRDTLKIIMSALAKTCRHRDTPSSTTTTHYSPFIQLSGASKLCRESGTAIRSSPEIRKHVIDREPRLVFKHDQRWTSELCPYTSICSANYGPPARTQLPRFLRARARTPCTPCTPLRANELSFPASHGASTERQSCAASSSNWQQLGIIGSNIR